MAKSGTFLKFLNWLRGRQMPSALTRPYGKIARRLESESFEATFHKHGMSRDEALAFVGPLYLKKLHAMRDDVQLAPSPHKEKRALIESLNGLISLIHADPIAALEVAHRAGLEHFEHALSLLKEHLPNNQKCLRMLDSGFISALHSQLPSKSRFNDTVGRAVAVLEQCPVCFPYRTEFNASVKWLGDTPLPLISQFHAVADCLNFAAELVVSHTTEPMGKDGVRLIDLDTKPGELEHGITLFRSAVDLVRGNRLTVEIVEEEPQNLAQRTVVALLGGGAGAFVWFHEFAHVLLPRLPDSKLNELRCDEFAIRLVFDTRNAESIVGVGLGLLCMMACAQTSLAEVGSTHPGPAERIRQYMAILDEERPNLDGRRVDQFFPLLTIPLAALKK